ncbi:putative membrane protein [Weissella oryzae SG25]|uniref:Putative membrane protein n=1 Tax=Weissella oryzae (strain DSM 25784 / JCM 18191 / LMG 30913 / SG25) TaxID=1329250 RepID=A0A069CXH1_WEIOS|nr:putative membrane protein [Weissella oryzae SG25]
MTKLLDQFENLINMDNFEFFKLLFKPIFYVGDKLFDFGMVVLKLYSPFLVLALLIAFITQ